jgi:hypothetical protein
VITKLLAKIICVAVCTGLIFGFASSASAYEPSASVVSRAEIRPSDPASSTACQEGQGAQSDVVVRDKTTTEPRQGSTTGPTLQGILWVLAYLIFLALMAVLAAVLVGWLTRRSGSNIWKSILAGLGSAVALDGLLVAMTPQVLQMVGCGS